MTAPPRPDIVFLDPETRARVEQCHGPLPDGSCPQVAIGEVIPCAGYALVPEGAEGAVPYAVPGGMTLCPLTLALALAVSSDAALAGDWPEHPGGTGELT